MIESMRRKSMSENLKALAYKLRMDTIDIIMAGGGGHIGGDMSVMEILTDLYCRQMNVSPENPEDPCKTEGQGQPHTKKREIWVPGKPESPGRLPFQADPEDPLTRLTARTCSLSLPKPPLPSSFWQPLS